MGDEVLSEDFEKAIFDFSSKLVDLDDFYVLSHHDADGITSCAIICDLLNFLGKSFDYHCLKQIDSVTVELIREHADKNLILCDFGSGQHSLLEAAGVTDYFVIDHHTPEKPYSLQINPHDFGIDGGRHISGAGMAYLCAKSLGRTTMAHIAVVGAVGDMQDSKGALESLNRIILDDACKQGLMEVTTDLRMFGRQSRSLSQMLAYSSDPIIPGLTGDQNACSAFIEGLGIPLMESGENRSYVELDASEREIFFSGLYMRLIDKNIPEYQINRMFGDVYTLSHEAFKSELRDSKEFSTVLNACGRQRQPDIGVEVCLGDRGVKWTQAQKLLEEHRRQLRAGIEFLSEIGCEQLDSLRYFDAGNTIDESIVGIVAGMAYGARIIPVDKPVLAFAQDRDDADFIKVSARANWVLVKKGLHLGNAMRDCSRKCGGEGGGHNIAAGARFPKNNKESFLKNCDETFTSQLA